MARLLIVARDGPRIGEVVAAFPNGHVWGKKEARPDFLQVDIPTLTIDGRLSKNLRPLLMPVFRQNAESGKLDQINRRRYILDPVMVRALIRQDRWYVMTTEDRARELIRRVNNKGVLVPGQVTKKKIDRDIARVDRGEVEI